MKRAALLLGASLATAHAMPTRAEYGPTHWGMSLAEVQQVAGADTELVEDDEDERIYNQRRLLSGSRAIDGVDYTIEYYFASRSGGLSLVRLTPTSESNCGALRATFVSQLGPGKDQTIRSRETTFMRIEMLHWDTGVAGEVIEFSQAHSSLPGNMGTTREILFCQVLYQARDFVDNSQPTGRQ